MRSWDQPVLSCGGNEEVFVGTLTMMSLADVGLEVITPCACVASCFWGAQRTSQTLSHCFSPSSLEGGWGQLLLFPGTPHNNGLSGFPTTIWWQSRDQDPGRQTSGLPACSLPHAAFRIDYLSHEDEKIYCHCYNGWRPFAGEPWERRLSLLFQAHEVADVWTD